MSYGGGVVDKTLFLPCSAHSCVKLRQSQLTFEETDIKAKVFVGSGVLSGFNRGNVNDKTALL